MVAVVQCASRAGGSPRLPIRSTPPRRGVSAAMTDDAVVSTTARTASVMLRTRSLCLMAHLRPGISARRASLSRLGHRRGGSVRAVGGDTIRPVTQPSAPAAASPQRFAALHHRVFRRYVLFGLLSGTADNIEHVISYWVIFQAFHSPALGGFAVISHWVPYLLFSVYSGALADRYDCRKLIQISQGLFMVASLAWGLLFLTGWLRMWHAVVILTIHGLAGVVGTTAVQVIIHDMVGPTQLQSAVRLYASSRNLAILLGPAVGGGLMLVLGPAWGLLVNVLAYLPLVTLLVFIPYTGHTRQGADTQPPSRPGFGDTLRLLRSVQLDRRLVTMIVLAGATSFFVGNAFHAQM